ncbi:CLUMA_CG005695, isoform A [Clunio marinus]|uniref:CLUMA_CG005695, isoform A n=1 Tax=Clunio marinus TaxID=568069 RepID=A0A1J1I1K8_9DIPT|nr:CLUMA_CG005695, isoform A [Clunio marinus]
MLVEMKARTVRWITDCLMIYCVICASPSSVQAQEKARALLLYSFDFPPSTLPTNNLISIQLDSITLNKIFADSEALGKVVKKINFRDVNGFQKLVTGESSKFSFFNDGGNTQCEVNCDVKCKEKIKPVFTTTQKPFVIKKVSTTVTPYVPSVSKKDEVITPRTTRFISTTKKVTKSFIFKKQSTTGPTYLPPVSVSKKDEFETPKTTKIFSTTSRSTTKQVTKPFVTKPSARITTVSKSTTTSRPFTPTRTRLSTPGPSYLPLSRISTVRRSTVTERSYPPATWPSTTRIYTQTFPTWSAPIRRSTTIVNVKSTPKYLYKEPSNTLIYAGEVEK